MCKYEYTELDTRGEKLISPCCLENYFSRLADATPEHCVVPVDDDTGEMAKEPVILFDRFNFETNMYLFFQGGVFSDAFRMTNCKSPESDIDMSLCKFLKTVSVTDTTLSRISFDNSLFLNGLDIGKCDIIKDAAFYSMKVSGEFYIVSTIFQETVNFSYSVFDKSSWMLNSVRFHMDTDFSSCTFNGPMEIDNATFMVGASFKNAVFNSVCDFIECEYYEDMFFESEKIENKMFNQSIRFNLKKDDIHGCFHFKNVDFFNIVEKDRKLLLKLQKDNKAIIGSGCMKYKVQSPVVKIKTDSINQNIIEELTFSFTKYIFHSSGFNLGVEFLDKNIGGISLFYFTDEDIELDEFLKRLDFWGTKYWAFPSDKSEVQLKRSVATVEILDDFVSKFTSIRKIAVRDVCGYWNEKDTKLLFKVIPATNNERILMRTLMELISSQKTNIIMQIQNLNVPNGQVNILENAKDIHIQQTVYTVPAEVTKSLELLIGRLSQMEVMELKKDVCDLSLEPSTENQESLKEKVLSFMNWHGIAVAQSMTASCIFEALRILLGVS